MSPEPPRLRGQKKARQSPYNLGEFPDEVIRNIGRLIVHRLAVGHADIGGNDFAGIFADAIDGTHFLKPLGITDIVWDECSWSAKTVKAAKPFLKPTVRLISGRNSPDYSYSIDNPREDIQKTGAAVLNIWNERVNQSLDEHNDLRIVVLMRNMNTLEFTLFEDAAVRYTPSNYYWELNRNKNFWGFEKTSGNRFFTWQPSGSQFTIDKTVPGSTHKFRLTRHPGLVELQTVLELIGFEESWIEQIP